MDDRTELIVMWAGLFFLYFAVGMFTGGAWWWSLVYAGLAVAALFMIGRIMHQLEALWTRKRSLKNQNLPK